MEYSIEQIKNFAGERIKKLLNNEYIIESLQNSEHLYYGEMEEKYSAVIRNANPNSRLFKSTYED